MTDEPPHWFGEPIEDEAPPVDPPTVAADWFSDIESDPLPKRSTASQATEAPETARREQATADSEATAEATESGAESTGSATAGSGAESAAATASETGRAGTAEPSGAPEMDGTRETTAGEIDDADDSGGFVSWLKSLFGLS